MKLKEKDKKGKDRIKRKIGNYLMIAGTALVLAALSLFLWNAWEDRNAGKAAQEILAQMEEMLSEADFSLDSDMTCAMIDGHTYIGSLSIPALGLKLPVMSDWSYSQLKISPCRYSGSAVGGDLVVAAHNYARHFGNLKKLSTGDIVYFTDMKGTVSAYEVAEIDLLAPTSLEEMTDSGYPLTLFTCTYGGQSRMTVRCERAEKQGLPH